VLYTQNTFDFDHPLALLIFSAQISPSSLHSIRFIAFEPQRHVYVLKPGNPSNYRTGVGGKSFQREEWAQMWHVIADMQGLEKVRIRFRAPCVGWTVEDVLDPLWSVTRPLRVFDVDAPWIAEEMGSEADEGWREIPFKLLGAG
jgi:hypothetical protein